MRNSPSAAIVYTGQSGGRGDGTGAAALLDSHPDFLPYAQNIFNQKRQQDAQLAIQQRQAQKEFQKFLNSPEVGKSSLKHQQEVQRALDDFQKTAISLGSGKITGKDGRKLDPLNDYDFEAQGILGPKKMYAESVAETGRRNDLRFQEIIEVAKKNPKYDMGHLNKWIKQYQEAPDIATETKLLDEGSPLKVNRTTLDIVHDLAPKLMTAINETGNKTTLTEAIVRDNTDILVDEYLNSNEGQEDYEAGVIDGRWKDEEGMKESVYRVAAAQNPGKTSVTYDEPRSTGDGSGGSKGGARFIPSTNPKVSNTTGTNVVTANWGTQAPPTLSFVDENGQPVLGKFVAAKQTSDGKSWIAEVQVSEDEVVPWTPTELIKIEEEQVINPDFQPEPKTKVVSRVVRVPLDNRPGYQGNDNYSTISDAVGQPLEQVISQGGKKTSGKYVGLDEDGNPIFE